MHRRHFLQATSAGFLSAGHLANQVLAREPINRTAPGAVKLSLAAYSLRPYFRYMKGKTQKFAASPESAPVKAPLLMEDFLVYCQSLGVEAAELTAYFLTPNQSDDLSASSLPTDESLRRLRAKAAERKIAISGTAIGNNFTVGAGEKLQSEISIAKKWIEKASVLGAPHIRFFAGKGSQLEKEPTRIDEAIDALQTCAEVAAQKKIYLGVENHGNLTGTQMLTIMDRVESPWIGMNLDTGNFLSEDPYADIQRCVPYAVNVQVKTMMRTPEGKKYPADLDRVAGILRDGGYQGYVALEYEEENQFEEIPKALDQLRTALKL